jgi:hypothetical protein
VPELVLELDAAYSGDSFEASSEAERSHELTYVDIDTFLASFEFCPTRVGTKELRSSCQLHLYFACSNLPVARQRACNPL